MMASSPIGRWNTFTGKALEKSTYGTEHALRQHAPYAEIAPPGWNAREADAHPNQGNPSSGVVSAGSIDNTYLPSPLTNSWGKARELARNEVPSKLGLSQATDLLVVAKGARMPPPKMTVADMNSVRAFHRSISCHQHPSKNFVVADTIENHHLLSIITTIAHVP